MCSMPGRTLLPCCSFPVGPSPASAPVAQWIERVPSKHQVAGSIPAGRTQPRRLRSTCAMTCTLSAHVGADTRTGPGSAARRPAALGSILAGFHTQAAADQASMARAEGCGQRPAASRWAMKGGSTSVFGAQLADVGAEPGDVTEGEVGLAQIAEQADRRLVATLTRRDEDTGLDQPASTQGSHRQTSKGSAPGSASRCGPSASNHRPWTTGTAQSSRPSRPAAHSPAKSPTRSSCPPA